MTQLLGATQSLLILISVGTFICSIKKTLNCIQKQREFERAFANYYKIEENEQQGEELDPDFFVLLPLELKHANFSKLCRQHKPKNAQDFSGEQPSNDETSEPSIEWIFLRLKRLSKHKRIVKVEAIKCGQKYALIAAEDRFSGYVLKSDDYDREVYSIHDKFQRDRTSSSENIEIHVQEVKADINKAD